MTTTVSQTVRFRNHVHTESQVLYPTVGTPVVYDSISYESSTNFRTGVSNPLWRWQILNHMNAGTSMQARHVRRKPINMSAEEWKVSRYTGSKRLYKSSYARSYLPLVLYFSGTQPSETIANNQALSRLDQKIRSAQSALQGGVIAGEAAETWRMLRHPLKGLTGGLWDYLGKLRKRRSRHRNRRRRREINKRTLADTWLESSFGWSPFINDLNEILRLQHSKVHSDYQVVSAQSKQTEKSIYAESWSPSVPTFPYYTYKLILDKEVSVRYTTELAARAPSAFRYFGFGFADFAPTLWELLPWSFLIDYFTNLGDIVSAASNGSISTTWTMKTVRYTARITAVPLGLQLDPSTSTWKYDTGYCTPGIDGAYSQWKEVLRNPYIGSLVPGFSFEIPGLHNWKRYVNIFALKHSARSITPYT